MLQSILLATDFRPASQEAATAAAELAAAFGSRIALLHVLEPLPAWPAALHEERRQALAESLRESARRLATEKADAADWSVVVGSPAHAIVHKANEINADLIVMGAGERPRLDWFAAGPITEAVIEHAAQPVLAVRPGEPVARFRTILCPVDQSDASGRGLRNAVRLARVFHSRLVVLTVVPEVSWLTAATETGHLAGARAEYESKWRDEFERFLSEIDFTDVEWTKEVRRGVAHEQIITAAREHQADVIVMGATGRTGLARLLLGSTTRRVLRQLPCSLLTLKEERAVEDMIAADARTAELLMAEGRELLRPGCYDLALTKFRQVLAIDPFHAAALMGMAEAYEKLGQPEEAEFYRGRAEGQR
jgi:nucleotide-binding universal stress UspA family protein